MKEFKGTKGEWTSFKPEDSNGYVYVDSDETTQGGVATCYNSLGNSIEDAKLIAAAPELLQALQKAKKNIEAAHKMLESTSVLCSKGIFEIIDKAINKALN